MNILRVKPCWISRSRTFEHSARLFLLTVLRYRKPCKIMGIQFKDAECVDNTLQVEGIGYEVDFFKPPLYLLRFTIFSGDELIVDLDIDTAIQFRKELQRQIMKAKAMEKEGNNG